MGQTRIHLSGSTSGKPIPVAQTATAGTVIHTAVAGAEELDSLFLWASNVTAGAVTLTLEWGGASDPANHLIKSYSITANSAPIQIAAGLIMNGGLVIGAFAGSANAINITGFANRTTR